MNDIQGILEWIDNCGNGVMNVGAMRDLAAAYREKCEELEEVNKKYRTLKRLIAEFLDDPLSNVWVNRIREEIK